LKALLEALETFIGSLPSDVGYLLAYKWGNWEKRIEVPPTHIE